MSEWQPIETAPRDGETVLLHGKVFHGTPFPGHWDIGPFERLDQPWRDAITGQRLYAHSVTHWMPLPKQPAPSALERRSTHHVHRGPESISCFCDATDDHSIGQEQAHPKAPVLAQDVTNLVIAAREALEFTFGIDGEELKALDRAVEAFADRVPYDEDPYDPIYMLSSARKAKGWEA